MCRLHLIWEIRIGFRLELDFKSQLCDSQLR
jgi:hypothetical protein